MIQQRMRAVLVSAALAATLLTPLTAHAASLSIGDGTGDTWREVIAQGKVTGFEPAGSAPNSDIVAVKVKHTARRVKIRTTFVDIANNAEGVVTQTRIKTNEGRRFRVFVAKDGDDSGAESYLYKRRCGGVHNKISWSRNTVKVSIPRSCLSSPKWIKVASGGGNYWERGDASRASYRDQVGTTGATSPGMSGKIRRG